MNVFLARVAKSILNGEPGLDRTTAQKVMDSAVGDDLYDLFYWANRIRLARVGPKISLCSIVAGKIGLCSEDCAFCGQSAHCKPPLLNQGNQLSAQEIVFAAETARQMGAACFGIVNSGRGPSDAELEQLTPILRKLSKLEKPSLCASLGILSDSQAQYLSQLGVRRYNHNLETSRRFFPSVVTTHTYDDRLSTVQAVKRSGMSLCCGGIFGLGETLQDRLDLAESLAQIGPDEVPLNFLHPLENTPLAKAEPVKPLEILRTIAIFRFVLPDAQIKVAGGREYNLRDLQSWIFLAGASGCIIGNYLLTRGRSVQDDRQMLSDLELPIAKEMAEIGHEITA